MFLPIVPCFLLAPFQKLALHFKISLHKERINKFSKRSVAKKIYNKIKRYADVIKFKQVMDKQLKTSIIRILSGCTQLTMKILVIIFQLKLQKRPPSDSEAILSQLSLSLSVFFLLPFLPYYPLCICSPEFIIISSYSLSLISTQKALNIIISAVYQ